MLCRCYIVRPRLKIIRSCRYRSLVCTAVGSIAAQRWEEGNRKRSGDKEQGRKGVALFRRLRQEIIVSRPT